MTSLSARPAIIDWGLGRLKRLATPILLSQTMGRFVARLFRDRIPHRSLVIDTSDPVVSPQIKAALLMRAYESGEYRFVQRYLPIDGDVLELGGSLGVVSCTIRRRIATDRRLVTVEADPRLAASLRRNLSINDCQVNVAVEQVAIAYDGAPTVAFSLGETSVSGRIDNTATGLQRIEVPARTVSALVASHDLRDFSLVSDIEGVEWQILRKDRDCLAKARLIIMETHDNPVFGRWTDLIEALTGTGLFRLIDRHGPVVVLAGAGYPG